MWIFDYSIWDQTVRHDLHHRGDLAKACDPTFRLLMGCFPSVLLSRKGLAEGHDSLLSVKMSACLVKLSGAFFGGIVFNVGILTTSVKSE